MANLPIRTKILAGFGSVVFVLLIVASVAYLGAIKTGQAFSDYSQRVQGVEIVRQLDRDMVDLRRHIREFAQLGTAEEASRSREIAANLRQQISVARDLIKIPENRRRLENADSSFTSYLADFEAVTKLKAEQASLIREGLEPSAAIFQKNVEALLAEAQAEVGGTRDIAYATLMRHGLQARLATAKMVGSQTSALAGKAQSDLAKAKTVLSKIAETEPPARQTQLGEIKTALDHYEAAMIRSAATSEQLDKLINTSMSPKATTIAEDMLAVRETGIAEMHRIEAEAHSVQSTSQTLTLLLAVAGLVLGGGIAVTVGSGISRPVVAMSQSMNCLAAGDKAIAIPGLERGDELGGMAKAVEVFRASMLANDRMTAAQQTQAEKNQAHARHIEKLAEAYDLMATKILDSVAAAATQLRTSASSMSDTAETTTTRSAAVAAAAEQASSNVQTVAAASEELTASIHEISRQVGQSSNIASSAVAEANRTNDQVRSLAEAAQKIGDVVNLINDIASQTNLLALNATIEAARAGEAGKGFAVVANEVKTLANQTARATDEISVQIAAVQTATRDAVAAIGQIGATIAEVNDIATTIASAVEQQGAATQEIARNAQQAATGTHEVTTNISGVSGAAREAGHAAHDVLAAATDLSRQCEDFRISTQKFLQDVRNA